jgi:hypothetical protein
MDSKKAVPIHVEEPNFSNLSLDDKVRLANRDSGPSAIRITDEELLETLRNLILSHWQITDERDFFPAPQPVSLNAEIFLN